MTDKKENHSPQDDNSFKPLLPEKKKGAFPLFLGLLAGVALIGAGGWYVYTETTTSSQRPAPLAKLEKEPPITKVKTFFREKNNPFHVFQDMKNQFQKNNETDFASPSSRGKNIETLIQEPASPPPPSRHAKGEPAPLSAVEERLLALETQINAITENLVNQQTTASPNYSAQTNDMVLMQLRNMQEKIDQLQQEQNTKKEQFNQRLRAITLIERLEGDIYAGSDYGETLTSLIRIAPRLGLDEEPLHALQQTAQDAPLSLASLMESFTQATHKAAPFAKHEQGNFSAKLQEALAPVVTIRRVDVESSDASDEAHIARAENELKAGNVDMTLAHLRQLSPRTSGYYETWVAEAEQFQKITQAVESLKTAAHQPE